MKLNMGKADRAIRAVLGVVIGVLGIVFQSWWGLIALIPLGTAAVGTCPAYLPFGMKTCRTDVSKEEQTSPAENA